MDKGLKHIILLTSAAICMLAACDKIHEFPEKGQEVDPTEVETRIHVNCKVRLTGLDVLTKDGLLSTLDEDSASLYDRRLLVSIRSAEYVDTVVESHVIIRDVSDTSEYMIETSLQTRKYKLVVWMDYVRKGTVEDYYYNTSNGEALNAIHTLPADRYVAGSDFKDAQYFLSDIDLTPYAGQWYADIVIKATLTRPVAKITILANDFPEYAESIGYTGSFSDLAEQISLDFSYDGYFPTGFNALTGRLNDAEAGYGFKAEARYPYTFQEKDYTRVGSDYVFVNGESSSVTISVTIKFKNGQFINQVNSVVVPITRGRETVVIFKFFTRDYVPGIGIDPGFDGEFNVYV